MEIPLEKIKLTINLKKIIKKKRNSYQEKSNNEI